MQETPPGHADRMALQLALTTLESLAEMLNERKRESEQIAAFRAKIRLLGGKLGGGGAGRVLLREDNVTRLEFNAAGQVCRSKPRRLLLLNDRVVCVAASGRPSEVEMVGGSSNNSGQGEKLCLKWSAGYVGLVAPVHGYGTEQA
jgi:Rho guanine nucleotide exchange factor 10